MKKQKNFDVNDLYELADHFDELVDEINEFRNSVQDEQDFLLSDNGKELRFELLGQLHDGIDQLSNALCDFIYAGAFRFKEEQQ